MRTKALIIAAAVFAVAACADAQQRTDLQGKPIMGPTPIENLRNLQMHGGDAPTPNQSYLVKQMEGVMSACLGGLFFELADGAHSEGNAWTRVHDIVHTPTAWRVTHQEYQYRGTQTGRPYTGSKVTFTNARWDPENSAINYGETKIAQNVTVDNPDKTIIIRNDSNTVVSLSYDETESLTNSFSTSVTHGMTLDVTVSSTTTVSGGYAGVSAEESLTAEFGVEKSTEETREESEEGTHEETISIEFDAQPHNYYLVALTKNHAVTYQPFTIDGVMDFDMELDIRGPGGRQRHRNPGNVKVQGVQGLQQFVYGYDTNYPQMQGFMDEAYTRTKNGLNCVMDPARRRLQISGVNQASLETDADYRVQSLGGTIPDHLGHLPVKDANELTGGGQ